MKTPGTKDLPKNFFRGKRDIFFWRKVDRLNPENWTDFFPLDKGHDPGLSGDHQGRGHRDMTMLDAPVGSVGDMTGRTGIPALRGEGVGSVQGGRKVPFRTR